MKRRRTRGNECVAAEEKGKERKKARKRPFERREREEMRLPLQWLPLPSIFVLSSVMRRLYSVARALKRERQKRVQGSAREGDEKAEERRESQLEREDRRARALRLPVCERVCIARSGEGYCIGTRRIRCGPVCLYIVPLSSDNSSATSSVEALAPYGRTLHNRER